jgi:hypothetical protein
MCDRLTQINLPMDSTALRRRRQRLPLVGRDAQVLRQAIVSR